MTDIINKVFNQKDEIINLTTQSLITGANGQCSL